MQNRFAKSTITLQASETAGLQAVPPKVAVAEEALVTIEPSRSHTTWVPVPLLCKRFNVRAPEAAAGRGELVGHAGEGEVPSAKKQRVRE